MPLSQVPAFKPAVPPIPLGASGTVLTSNGLTAATPPTFKVPSGGGSGIGSQLAYASAAGVTANANPAGFVSTVGRLNVNTAAGAANWTNLVAGADAQQLIILNLPGGNDLTLGAGFICIPGYTLSAGTATLLCYYTGTINAWVVIS